MTCQEMILSNEYISLIGQGEFPGLTKVEDIGGCEIKVDDYLQIYYVDQRTQMPLNATNYPYSAIPKCYGIMQKETGGIARNFSPLSLEAAGILQVQGKPLNLTGKGVICGFIDTGIRYQENAFRRSDGKTRIIRIWDQTIQSGKQPKDFPYGSEYTNEEIDQALMEENPYVIVPVTDENGHGTVLASVTAGSMLSDPSGYTGAAPDCDIAVVKLKEAKDNIRKFYGITTNSPCYDETDIILAIEYLQDLANIVKKPVVICIGLGTSYGNHSGSSPLTKYISRVASKINRVIFIASGNEGNEAHHAQGIIKEKTEILEIRVGEDVDGFVQEIWGRIPYLFTLAIRSPSGELASEIGLKMNQQYVYRFLYEGTIVTVDSEIVEISSGRQLMRIQFQKPVAGIWTIQLRRRGEEGEIPYNSWLPISDFLTDSVFFLTPNPYITLTEPSASLTSITVGAYQSENDSIDPVSGRGFTNTGDIKPDIAAPGVKVSTIQGELSGTGIACAIAAGAAAQYMQWAVTEGNDSRANSQTVKNFFIRGAQRKANISVPNREWGWGFLNIQNSFRQYIV